LTCFHSPSTPRGRVRKRENMPCNVHFHLVIIVRAWYWAILVVFVHCTRQQAIRGAMKLFEIRRLMGWLCRSIAYSRRRSETRRTMQMHLSNVEEREMGFTRARPTNWKCFSHGFSCNNLKLKLVRRHLHLEVNVNHIIIVFHLMGKLLEIRG
jgi:hypothetical protein